MSSVACFEELHTTLMRLVITTPSRFAQDADGNVYSSAGPAYSFWQRYLDVFEAVKVVGRLSARSNGTGHPVEGPGVSFSALPYYLGPWQYVRKAYRIQAVLKTVVGPEDAVILRVPCQIASGLFRVLRQVNRPYAVEVVGDPHDVFAPGAVKHPLRPFFRRWFSAQLRRQCAEACAAAYVTERALQQRYPPAPDAFTTHYSSIELEDSAFAAEPRVYHSMPVPARLILVGSLAQMYKAPDVLIDAVALCVARGMDICLTIVGDGKHRPELEARADRVGVGRRVTFTGTLSAGEAVRAQLDQADLFVLPSRTEGLPRAMIEAMARGLPCIGSTVGGIPELLPAEDLVPPGDAHALAGKIIGMLSHPARMTHSAARNLEKAQTYHQDILHARRIEFYTHVRHATEAWPKK